MTLSSSSLAIVSLVEELEDALVVKPFDFFNDFSFILESCIILYDQN